MGTVDLKTELSRRLRHRQGLISQARALVEKAESKSRDFTSVEYGVWDELWEGIDSELVEIEKIRAALAEARERTPFGQSRRDAHHDRPRSPEPTRHPTPDQMRQARKAHPDLCEKICFHEAGHAVIGLLEGRGIEEIGVELDRTHKPCAGWFLSRRENRSPEGHMAGIAAELIRWPQGSPMLGKASEGPLGDWDSSWRGDWEKVEGHYRGPHHYSHAEGHVHHILGAALSTLRDHWPGVRALSERLIEVGYIEGPEAEGIFVQALPVYMRNELRRTLDQKAWEEKQRIRREKGRVA